MSKGWHILREDGAVCIARRLPVRFDVKAEAVFPELRMVPLAQQIRQDLWRALRRVRGFSPVVRAEAAPGGILVSAGGRIDGRFDRHGIEARIATLLAHPGHVARWARWAR